MSRSRLSSRQEHELLQYVSAVLTSSNEEEVLSALSEITLPEPYKFRIKIIYATGLPVEVFREATRRDYRLHQLGRSQFAFRLKQHAVGAAQPELSFLVVRPSAFQVGPQVAALVSASTSRQWEAIRRLTRYLYPQVVPVLLSQSELISSAQRLRLLARHAVQVRSFTAKERAETESGAISRSLREWTEEDLDRVLVSVQDRRQILTSLELDFYPQAGGHTYILPKATCKIRKQGEIEVTGSLDVILQSAAADIARVGEKKLLFYSNRGLREANYRPRPVAISLTRSVFDDLAEVREFVDILRAFPHSMHAVEHGNPYARIRLTDLLDYSTFEVWAIPPSRIAVLPGLRASEAAFERLVHFVFDRFREGEIADYVPTG